MKFRAPCIALVVLTACTSGVSGIGQGSPDAGGASCMNDDACPTNQHCDDTTRRCIDGTGNDCLKADDCGPGKTCEIVPACGASRCHGNRCAPALCDRHEDCDGLLCLDGRCGEAPACDRDGMCPPGTTCEFGHCAPEQPCEEDADCADDGLICLQGGCHTPIPCMMSQDCPDALRCQDGVCREPCARDEDCKDAPRSSCDQASGECQARCFGDRQCRSGSICEDFSCLPAQCANDSECDATRDEECVGGAEGHGRCVVAPRCTPGQTECQANFFCANDGRCRELPTCAGDRACTGPAYCESGHCQPAMPCTAGSCPGEQTCIGGRCVPGGCRGLDDCAVAGEICVGGVCQLPPSPATITDVRIITPPGVVRPGTHYRFAAIAVNAAGTVVPGVPFRWTSTSSVVAAIDATGLATGGPRAGETEIIARASTGTMNVSSRPVSLTNLGALPAGDVRVTVIELFSGSPLVGAGVVIRAGSTTATLTTDARGVAQISGLPETAPLSVTAGDLAHDWVSVVGTAVRDLALALPTLSRNDRAAGLKGAVDFSRVTTTGDIAYSLSGPSFASPLIGFSAERLFGSDVHTVTVPGVNLRVPVPASSTLSVTAFGTTLPLKERYYTEADPGLRAAWSFGGRVAADVLRGQGGGSGPGDLLGSTLPYFQRFQHAVRPAVDVRTTGKVADTADLDKDGNSTELVPDWSMFPDVPLAPWAEQSLRYQVHTAGARLPFVTGGNANTLIIVTGTLLPGIGFVPLGLDGLQDNSGNGMVASFTTRVAPPHSGLEVGEFAVLATAFRVGPTGLPGPGSTRLLVASRLPDTVDFADGWIDSPQSARWFPSARELAVPPVTGADLVRVRFASPNGGWHVYAEPNAARFELPPAPVGGVDRTTSATISADLIDRTTGGDAGSVFDIASGGALSLDRQTRGFSSGPVVYQR